MMKHKQVFKFYWLLLAFHFIASGESFGKQPANRESFEVIAITGTAEVRSIFSENWRTVTKGDFVKLSSLLKVSPLSSITISYKGENLDNLPAAYKTDFTFNSPIMIRLDEKLMAARLSSLYYSEDAALAKGSQAVEIEKSVYAQLFEYVYEFLPSKFDLVSDADYTRNRLGIHDAPKSRQKKIHLILPRDDVERFAVEFPYRFRVMWKAYQSNASRSGVFIWPAEDKRPSKPVILTSSQAVFVSINRPGDYLLQVMSEDQAYASKVAPVHISEYAKVFPDGIANQDQSETEFIGPQPNVLILVKDQHGQITFERSQGKNEAKDVLNYIEIDMPNGSSVFKCKAATPQCKVKLSIGKYRWRQVTKTKDSTASGLWNPFTIKTLSSTKDFQSQMNHLSTYSGVLVE